MKTKLLKKVRKRFEIIEVKKIGKNDLKYVDTSQLKLPFYIVVDRRSIIYPLGASQTYEKAFDFMIKHVLYTYRDKATNRLRTEKVYYKRN